MTTGGVLIAFLNLLSVPLEAVWTEKIFQSRDDIKWKITDARAGMNKGFPLRPEAISSPGGRQGDVARGVLVHPLQRGMLDKHISRTGIMKF